MSGFWLSVARFAARRAGNVHVLRVLPEPTDEEWAAYAAAASTTGVSITSDTSGAS